jgi:DNA-binding transcriptional LysR family regulator
MKLDGVAAFVTVASTGSISEAARQLRLSKSAVSERLTELERALDANLIQRNSRQLALTEDGVAFLERAKRIVAEAGEAANELSRRRGEVAGPLRIACPRGFADTHLAAAIFSFMERYPEVTATVDADDRLVDAASGFDAIIRISGAELPKLALETITSVVAIWSPRRRTSRSTAGRNPSRIWRSTRPSTTWSATRTTGASVSAMTWSSRAWRRGCA